MKKTQMALAAVALVASTAAMAQVTVSGRFDAGVQNGSGTADLNGTTAGSIKRAYSGAGLLAPNQLNFSGSEDLGNGMKASFMVSTLLDGGLLGSPLFLQQNVGISGDFGALKIGTQVDSFWGAGLANFDVTGGGNMGSAVTAAFMHGATGVFHNNTVSYTAPSIAGVNLAGSYVVNDGSTARSTAAIKQGDYSVAGTADVGSVKLGGGYSVVNTNKSFFLGAGTDLGFGTVNVIYLNSNAVSGVANKSATTTGINGKVPLVGALAATAGYYSTDGTTINGTNTSVGLLYGLSKQTTVFGNYEKATGNTKLGFGYSGTGQGTAGDIVTVGVAHSF